MAAPRRQIFRESAMKEYVQRREQDILPYIVSPPVFAAAWFLLALFLLAGLLAWSAQLPTFASASGVITPQGQVSSSNNNTQALIFFPATTAPTLRTGQPIQLQVGSTGSQVSTAITSVNSSVMSPADARKLYQLDAGEAQVITQPSIVAIVSLSKTTLAVHTFVGSTINARVQTGTHSVLSQILT